MNPPLPKRHESKGRRRLRRRRTRRWIQRLTTPNALRTALFLLGCWAFLILPVAVAQTTETTAPPEEGAAPPEGEASSSVTNALEGAVQGLLQNASSSQAPATYSVGQLYTLFFTLDGPSGDGLLRKPREILEFAGYMENITLSFPPEFATLEEIRNVSTKCTYTGQRSFDTDLSVVANAKQIAFLTTPTQKYKRNDNQKQQTSSYSYYSRSKSIFYSTLSPPSPLSSVSVSQVAAVKTVVTTTTTTTSTSSRQAQTPEAQTSKQTEQGEIMTTTQEEEEENNPIWEAILRANTTYQYTYLMNYSSNEVNVSMYPRYYEAKMRNSKHAFEYKMRQILNVSDGNVLKIQDILVGTPDTVNGMDGISAFDDPKAADSDTLLVNGGSLTVNVTNSIYNDGNVSNVNISTASPNLTPALTTAPITATLAPVQPTPIPTISSAPTLSAQPSTSPTSTPSVQPTRFPTSSPTLYPTFTTNSSARGRYELTYIVETSRAPKTLFINKTIFCNIMQNYTDVLAEEEGHNPELIYTSCPSIDGGFTVTPPIYANLPPYQSPVLAPPGQELQEAPPPPPDGFPQDTDGDGDLDIPIPPSFLPISTTPPTEVPTTPSPPTVQPVPVLEGEQQQESGGGGRFLRYYYNRKRDRQQQDEDEQEEEEPPPQRVLQDELQVNWTNFPTSYAPTTVPSIAPSYSAAPSDVPSVSLVPTVSMEPSLDPTLSPAPTATPSWQYRYTIVMRWTSRYYNVSDYPDNLELYLQNETNQQDLEAQLIIKFNLSMSVDSLRVVSFQQFTDITKAPTEEPSSSPSTQPSVYQTLHPTDPEPTFPPIPANATLPPDLGPTDPREPSAVTLAPTQLPPGSTPKPTLKPGGGDGGGGGGGKNGDSTGIVIGVVVVVIFFSIFLMGGLFLLYKKRREKKRNAYNNIINKRPSEGVEGIVGGAEASATMIPPTLPTDPISTAGTQTSPVSVDAATTPSTPPNKYNYSPPNATGVQQQQQPHHSKDHSSGSTSLASTVSDAVAGQSSGGGGPTTTTVGANSPARSILSDIEEDPYSTDGLGDYDDDDANDDASGLRPVPALSSSGSLAGGGGGSPGGGGGGPVLDPFAQYNDSKLETMRSKVEGNVSGLDGMMSQAMTRALISGGGGVTSSSASSTEIPVWHGAKSGVEIEANALWEVTEFLKRHPHVREDQRQDYMQQLLEKMVTTVREGYVDPEDASRTIHECAHLLGLELANQLPMETILLTGMQKTTTAQDVRTTMKVFGPVVDAAVASGERGFGFVRFKTQKSIADAMHQHRTSEVVIKNVAITLRLLSEHQDGEFHV